MFAKLTNIVVHLVFQMDRDVEDSALAVSEFGHTSHALYNLLWHFFKKIHQILERIELDFSHDLIGHKARNFQEFGDLTLH